MKPIPSPKDREHTQVQSHTQVQLQSQSQSQKRAKKLSKFFPEEDIRSKNKGSMSMSLHDQAILAQIGGILNDVLDEVRNEYRLTNISLGLTEIKDITPPYIFQSTQCVEWIQTYYRTYSKLDSPDCYIPGTDPLEPKIDRKFKYYYQLGIFNTPIQVGRLLTKCHQYCGIALASNYGNRKNWILNPPR